MGDLTQEIGSLLYSREQTTLIDKALLEKRKQMLMAKYARGVSVLSAKALEL